ncbi:methyltransferase domain-containing protein [Pedobacter polaris]|uniref:tRNA1(Val) (adenine(37)-N6)-methyltransferase n=1 Tax=Pedobacter polaris TaxID=2571273 RepID=A0A4U1CIU5_9SPHI|nr:methyltransferase [Pedobacter polaris]TKC06630.1 methyltransferase domain-containing protein [Pedobacter polaris]
MSIFKFKQFEVDQTDCAMKINTDGVLLAAIAESIDPKQILDIGTGTGVIALMLAQRFPEALIEAVEIDEQASATAKRNFQSSVFSNRLIVNHTAIEQYNNAKQFDLIISNPPFFVNDLRNSEEKKGIARHTNEVFFQDLITKVASLLNTNGSFWFILPVKQAELLIEKAKDFRFSAAKIIQLHSDVSKPVFRYIVNLAKSKVDTKIEHFYIYESEKVYTQAYKKLLKDFFLGY